MTRNMLSIALGSAASLALLTSLPVAATELVYNGGFELPGVLVGSSLSVPSGSTVGGWKVLGGSGSIYTAKVGGGWPGPFEGTDYLYLNNDGVDGVSIAQSITLDAATTYHPRNGSWRVPRPGEASKGAVNWCFGRLTQWVNRDASDKGP